VNVVVCSTAQSEINSTVEEINSKLKSNSSVLGIKCDVGIRSEVDSIVNSATEKFGSENKKNNGLLSKFWTINLATTYYS
jgi:NAD(P)-dependent dehydrogenase (short-subunit alcohol dehydrogenase family)